MPSSLADCVVGEAQGIPITTGVKDADKSLAISPVCFRGFGRVWSVLLPVDVCHVFAIGCQKTK